MKRFWEIVMMMKTAAAYCCCGTMCVYLCVMLVLGMETVSRPILFSLLLTGAAAGALQTLAFTDAVLKRLAYGWRMLLFAVLFFGALTAIALGFGWFPAEFGGNWVTFGAIFLFIFLLVCAGFELYYRVTGARYDGMLGQYRKARERARQAGKTDL